MGHSKHFMQQNNLTGVGRPYKLISVRLPAEGVGRLRLRETGVEGPAGGLPLGGTRRRLAVRGGERREGIVSFESDRGKGGEMRRVLPIAFVILLSASVAFAAGLGRLGIFGDTGGASCAITQPASGLFQIHLVHIETDGSTGFQFKAPKPDCVNATYLNDINVFPVVVGNTQTGIAVAYPECKVGSFLICSMQFLSLGATPPCCLYYILPDPNTIPVDYYVSDCDYNVLPGSVKGGVVTQTADCDCESIPNEDTSWGQIKALYSAE
jgi:hypothetical protein